jgi:predicted dinucleotide-binding enzyme
MSLWWRRRRARSKTLQRLWADIRESSYRRWFLAPGGYELKHDNGTSAAEQLARLVPTARVVTAFTSISSALVRDPAKGEKPTVFTCADDDKARSVVIGLAGEIGFEGVDAGRLDTSLNVENLGLLVGQLAYGAGYGKRVSLRAYVAG